MTVLVTLTENTNEQMFQNDASLNCGTADLYTNSDMIPSKVFRVPTAFHCVQAIEMIGTDKKFAAAEPLHHCRVRVTYLRSVVVISNERIKGENHPMRTSTLSGHRRWRPSSTVGGQSKMVGA